jgi:hypothetical protein
MSGFLPVSGGLFRFDYFVSQAHSSFFSGTDLSQDFTQVPAPAAPEPGTLSLMGLGGASLFARLRRRIRMRAGARSPTRHVPFPRRWTGAHRDWAAVALTGSATAHSRGPP